MYVDGDVGAPRLELNDGGAGLSGGDARGPSALLRRIGGVDVVREIAAVPVAAGALACHAPLLQRGSWCCGKANGGGQRGVRKGGIRKKMHANFDVSPIVTRVSDHSLYTQPVDSHASTAA